MVFGIGFTIEIGDIPSMLFDTVMSLLAIHLEVISLYRTIFHITMPLPNKLPLVSGAGLVTLVVAFHSKSDADILFFFTLPSLSEWFLRSALT